MSDGSRTGALREIMRSWKSRLFVGLPITAGSYQFGCDQFDWPKLPALWGMTGGGLPWWGWLLIAQAGFVYALFEYVRRYVPVSSHPHAGSDLAGEAEISRLETRLDERLAQISAGAIDHSLGTKDALLAQLSEEAEARIGLNKKIEKLGELTNQNHAFARAQIVSLYNAIGAIYQREILEELSERLEAKGEALRTPTTEKVQLADYEWHKWKEGHREWRDILAEWCAIANCYSTQTSQKVLHVSAEELQSGGEAKVSQFPTAEDFMAYKEFNIRFFKWKYWQDEVKEAVLRVATEGTAESRPLTP